jgi:hypothetical protein
MGRELSMKQASAAAWAHDEFGGVQVEDPRWRKRLILVAEQAARRPGGKVSEVFWNDAARQGAYGLLESKAVEGSQVGAAMFQACARRCASELFVFCPVDGSSLTVTDLARSKEFGSIGSHRQGARGLKVISALAVSPQGVPQGLTAQVWWARPKRRASKHRDARKTEEKEIQHWIEAMGQTRQVMESHAPVTRLWFQLDREGDAWPILEKADAGEHWFTVRGSHNRRVLLANGEKTHLRTLLGGQPVESSYSLKVSAGPNRSQRTANMTVRGCTMTLDFRDKRTKRHFTKTVNVVLAREEGTAPASEKPIEWLLLTNRPVDTKEHLHQTVLGYAQRWRIEEFHRTWKSGACRVEESQLRSLQPLVKWATILAAVAVRVERIKLLSRREPDRPATDEFSPTELRAITLLRFGKSAKRRFSNAVIPTLGHATLWVAQLGGYTGKSSGGPPGSATLARGLEQVATLVQGLEALEGCD